MVKIVNCIFGEKFQKVFEAPQEGSVFFTNNPDLKPEIESKGWEYKYIDFPLSDHMQSSLQSKWIKFLQFDLQDDEYLYCDHKIKLTPQIISKIQQLSTKSILITRGPKHPNGRTVRQALEEVRQARYRNKKQTRSHLKTISEQWDVLIVRTGLIHYRINERVRELADAVYQDCMKTQNPHCQLFWALRMQEYKDIIRLVDFNEVGYVHKRRGPGNEPREKNRRRKRRRRR